MNPELIRVLWLEINMQRLWLLPGAIFGVALLAHHSAVAPPILRTLAMAAFVIATIVWGARQAANAVLDEARDHTWEIQRMSALTPWTMTWGKLAGATAMPWYGGIACLALFVYYAPPDGSSDALAWSALAVLVALALQAFALMLAVASVHYARCAGRRTNLFIVLFLLSLLLPELAALTLPGFGPLSETGASVSWYGGIYDGMVFNLVLLAALTAWAVIGAWRMMCIELEVRTTPCVWLAFIVFLALLVSGFDDGGAAPGMLRRWTSSAAAFACALGYLAAFAFARDPVRIRGVLSALAARRWRRALEEMPLAVSSVLLALLLATGASMLGAHGGITNERIDNLGAVTLVLALLMVRDLAVLAWLSFRRRTQRAEISALLVIALLNRVMPAIIVLSGFSELAVLVKPAPFAATASAIGIAAVHAAIAVALAVYAYRRALVPVTLRDDRKS